MGGWVAWRYALAQPARVDALLLIDAAGMPLRKGEKRPESNVGFRILEYPIGRWLATRVTPRMLVEQSLRGSVEKQDIVADAMIDRYWELLLFPGNREEIGRGTCRERVCQEVNIWVGGEILKKKK